MPFPRHCSASGHPAAGLRRAWGREPLAASERRRPPREYATSDDLGEGVEGPSAVVGTLIRVESEPRCDQEVRLDPLPGMWLLGSTASRAGHPAEPDVVDVDPVNDRRGGSMSMPRRCGSPRHSPVQAADNNRNGWREHLREREHEFPSPRPATSQRVCRPPRALAGTEAHRVASVDAVSSRPRWGQRLSGAVSLQAGLPARASCDWSAHAGGGGGLQRASRSRPVARWGLPARGDDARRAAGLGASIRAAAATLRGELAAGTPRDEQPNGVDARRPRRRTSPAGR